MCQILNPGMWREFNGQISVGLSAEDGSIVDKLGSRKGAVGPAIMNTTTVSLNGVESWLAEPTNRVFGHLCRRNYLIKVSNPWRP